MKKRLFLGGAVGGLMLALTPFAANASTRPAQNTPTCVVVTGPGGFNLQVGYAPNGPDGCQHI